VRARFLAVVLLVLSLLGIGTAAPALAASDTTPPVLHGVSLVAPGPFTAGDTVTVQWDATDDVGIAQVQVGYRDAVGHEKVVTATGGATSGQAVIDYRWAEGQATVRWVWVFDVNGNWAVYNPNGTWAAYPSASGAHLVDLHAAEFVTHDTGQDVTAPVLQSIARTSPATRTAGDSVTVATTVSDAHPYSGQLVFVDAACKQHTGSVVDSGWAEGPVHLQQVQLYDDSGNTRIYQADGTERSGPSSNGPWTTTTHTFDLAAIAFTTYATGADTTPPAVADVHLASSGPFVEGDSASVVWQATDATGVSSFGVELVDAAGKSHFAGSASSPVAVQVDSSWAVGPVHAQAVTAQDPVGNEVRDYRDGHATVTPSCGGPATHTLDLSALDFEVSGPSSGGAQDTTAPTPAALPFPSPVTLAASVPLRYTASDSGSGVASYDVRYTTSSATSGFTPWVLPASWQHVTSTQLGSPYLAPGRALCFSVRARDVAGNTSAWAPSRCVSRAYDDRVLTPSAGWSRLWQQSLYGGSALQTAGYGVTASTGTVTVRRIAVLAATCPTCGSVAVYSGGQLVGSLSLVSSTSVRRVLSLPMTELRTGVVTLRSATSGKPVLVDALVLSRV
jgi:hypothetical protein